MTDQRIHGILAPVVTPFDAELAPDPERLIRHCRWLLSNDVGLAVFGTNSEGNSLSVDERIDLLDRLVQAGIDPARMMPGTGACALPDAIRLTRHVTKLGCAGALVLPPFFYKGVSDEGLFRTFAEIIERVGDTRMRLYLYHIPPVAQVGFSVALIERLLAAYPKIVAGMKDSSQDWQNTKAVLDAVGSDLDVFVGSETFLLANLRNGGVGCISATANVNPGPIAGLYRHWRGADAEERQARLDVVRAAFQKRPMIPALKKAVAHHGHDPKWTRVRPPLVELNEAQVAEFMVELEQIGFTMPGLLDGKVRE